jgi:alpha-tubulin suppressor-like RCC1 family protein
VLIAAAEASSYALLVDGYIWAWGANGQGQLGDGTTDNRLSPVRIDGYGADTAMRLPLGGPMTSTMFVVAADGTAMGSGRNHKAQLGNGGTSNVLTAGVIPELGGGIVEIARGYEYTLVLKAVVPDCGATASVTDSLTSGADSTRQLTCAGDTEYGGDDCAFACAPGYYLSSGTSPLTCEADGSWAAAVCTECTAVAGCTGFVTCTTDSDEQCVPCSGVLQDLLDWLASETTPFTAEAIFYYCPTADVMDHQGVLTLDHGKQLFIDGSNGSGGSISFNGLFVDPRGVARAASVTLTNAQTSSFIVAATGHNDGGQLGLDDTTNRNSLEQLTLGGVVHVDAGGDFSAALTADGQAYLWGSNGNGQLGDGTTTNRPAPTHITTLGTDTIQLALGQEHSLALKQDGAVFSWGNGGDGRLGLGADACCSNRVSPTEIASLGTDNAYIAAQGAGGMSLKTDGRLFNWGSFTDLALGEHRVGVAPYSPTHLVEVGSDNVHVVAGSGHTLLLKADGSVVTWGWNNQGQLGNGATSAVRNPPARDTLPCTLIISALNSVREPQSLNCFAGDPGHRRPPVCRGADRSCEAEQLCHARRRLRMGLGFEQQRASRRRDDHETA